MRAMARARQGQKRVLKKKCFRSCTWIKGPKQTQNQKNKKNKTLKRLFGLASKDGFLFVFLGFEMQKQEKLVFFFEETHQKKVFFGFCISKPKKKKKNTQGRKKNIF